MFHEIKIFTSTRHFRLKIFSFWSDLLEQLTLSQSEPSLSPRLSTIQTGKSTPRLCQQNLCQSQCQNEIVKIFAGSTPTEILAVSTCTTIITQQEIASFKSDKKAFRSYLIDLSCILKLLSICPKFFNIYKVTNCTFEVHSDLLDWTRSPNLKVLQIIQWTKVK